MPVGAGAVGQSRRTVRAGGRRPVLACRDQRLLAVWGVRQLVRCPLQERPRRMPYHSRTRSHVAGDHGARPDERAGPDPDSAEDHRSGAQGRPALDYRPAQFPVSPGLQRPVLGGRPGIAVIEEQHAVTDEDLILNGYAIADEAVALDLAARPDL